MVESNSQNPLALKPTIKFVCSYGGRILPRYPDGKLRYHGGETRLLSVDRSVSFSELAVKLGEMCGTAVNLRCQLPTEDLDALVSITSDEDLANLIEEYDRAVVAAPPSLKIRAFLSAPKSPVKSPSPPSSASSSSNGSTSPKSPALASGRCVRHAPRPPVHPNSAGRPAGKVPVKYAYHYQYGGGNGSHPVYVIHNGSHWQ
ncbi:Octicosapeptide/Phox/Bem1p family protein [Striga hermonthica]|uniref:Octicosapeptide/Phox/Bem1p family protein n=1 Tax=Striga hermonthica TaxID=68872 RepID=A0A9N7MTC9_STRHE|nr:Octicosapeptide/Phox/Bem1p family protein [Striga hermonthica]